MKKIFSKLKIILMIFLVLFTFFHKPKQTQADALVAGGGMYLISLNPAILPIAVLGLTACLLVGYTVANWDDVTAFGSAVAKELTKMGYSVSDFVSGTSVKVNSNFKKAVKTAAKSTGSTIAPYSDSKGYVYSGNLRTKMGLSKNANYVQMFDYILLGNSVLGFKDKGWTESYDEKDFINVNQFSGYIKIAPIDSKYKWTLELEDANGSHYELDSLKVVTNNVGKVEGFNFSADYSNAKARRAKLVLTASEASDIEVLEVSVPALRINKRVSPLSTEKLKSRAIDSQNVDEYIDTAFPNDETIEFNPQADVTTASMVNMPKISNKTLTASQVKSLDDIQANAVSENTGSSSSAGSSSGFWSLLWNWLLRILNAILGIPAAILDGIKTLFATVTDWLAKIWQGICDLNIASTIVDWLSKLWTGICSIPSAIVSGVTGFWEKLLELVESIVKAIEGFNQAISNAVTGALEWCFGLDESWLKGRIETLKKTFDSKFPALKPINYKFSDKGSFDDLKMTVPYCGQVTVVESSIVMKYGSVLKNFLRAFFYLITALFFFKRFHKLTED